MKIENFDAFNNDVVSEKNNDSGDKNDVFLKKTGFRRPNKIFYYDYVNMTPYSLDFNYLHK